MGYKIKTKTTFIDVDSKKEYSIETVELTIAMLDATSRWDDIKHIMAYNRIPAIKALRSVMKYTREDSALLACKEVVDFVSMHLDSLRDHMAATYRD
jgi:hypothetical protein